MIELEGKYTSCKIFTGDIEQEAISQIYSFLNHPAFDGAKIRIMPDVHAGKGAVIGFTSSLTEFVIPNVIGVDIGCGVLAIDLGTDEIDFQDLDRFIKQNIPSGCEVNKKDVYADNKFVDAQLKEICERTQQDYFRVVCSLSSLGGGNHFIEVAQNDIGNKFLIVHTGSRNFGLKIANYHQSIAKKQHPFGDLSYLSGDEKDMYVSDMKKAQEFAALNRTFITDKIFGYLKDRRVIPDRVSSVHNYIDFKNRIVRKGAISAEYGQRVIIPLNMRDGSIIGIGLGNADWNLSAPHGAGRKMSRSKAKKEIKLEDFKKSMDGIYTSCVNQSTLDESPMAYKDSQAIIDSLSETVQVADLIKPIYNFKASE